MGETKRTRRRGRTRTYRRIREPPGGRPPFAHFLSKGIGIPPPGSPEKFQLPNASLAAPETTRPAVEKCRPSRALQNFFACGGGRGGRSEEKGQETQQGM